MNLPICMDEAFWMNSQLSIARHYGRISEGANVWYIVNSRGMDLWECSDEAIKLGRDKAIPAGEPADLVRADFIKYYKKLGRDRFLEIQKNNDDGTSEAVTVCTLQMAMKWLREEKGIAVVPILSSILDNERFLWDIEITVAKTNESYHQGWTYESYERACEVAIKYCLKNLI